MPFQYDDFFIVARKLIRRGMCPEMEDLQRIFEYRMDLHLGESELEVASRCLEEYGLEEWIDGSTGRQFTGC